MVDFAVHQLVPGLLRRLGEHTHADTAASTPLDDPQLLAAVEDAPRAALRSRAEFITLHCGAELPPEVHEMQTTARALGRAGELVESWRRASGLNEVQLRDDQYAWFWRKGHDHLRQLCRDVNHLVLDGVDPAVAQRTRLVAWGVEWEDIDTHLPRLDHAAAERACRLADANAFVYGKPHVVFDAVVDLDDEACDVACLISKGMGVWVDELLATARTMPLESFQALERLYDAAVDHSRGPDGRGRPASRQALFLDARDAAPGLTADAAELASRLVRGGLPFTKAAATARAAVLAA